MFLLRLLYYVKNAISTLLRRKVVFIPWYANESEFRAIVRRSGELVDFKTYEQWKYDSEVRALKYAFKGFIVVKCEIDKKGFFLWLQENKLKSRPSSREAYCKYKIDEIDKMTRNKHEATE
jgi:hypothetical protein